MEARPLLASQQQTKQKKHNHHSAPWSPRKLQQKRNTYNSGYSLVVTHLTTNPPVRCLNRAERTGSLVFNVLWSYVKILANVYFITLMLSPGTDRCIASAAIDLKLKVNADPQLMCSEIWGILE